MRGVTIAIWLLLPFAAAAYHYGPGQERLVLDRAEARFDEAARQARAGEHAQAVESWEAGLQELGALPATPERVAAARRARLERSKSGLLARTGLLPAVREELLGLLEEVQADPSVERGFVDEVRGAAAQAQFYYTWLLKLEGKPREAWEPEVEAARQHYSLLAEAATDPLEKQRHQADLEAAVRLQLLDPEELQGIAIPDQ